MNTATVSRIPVRTQDIIHTRPITLNDRRILDHISRKMLVVNTVIWHMEGYTEQPRAESQAVQP